MEKWYFTFGHAHFHPVNGKSLGGHYVVIPGGYEEARAIMLQRFGAKWAFQYAGGDCDEAGCTLRGDMSHRCAGVTRFNLTKLDLDF